MQTAFHAGLFYALWYPKRWLPLTSGLPHDLNSELKSSLREAAGLSRELARTIFHSMAKHGPKLDRQQLLLGRLVDVGAELLTISVSASRAHALGDEKSLDLARYIAKRGIHRCHQLFHAASHAPDTSGYQLAQSLQKDPLIDQI